MVLTVCLPFLISCKIITVKALLSPQGAYLILDTPEGGLLETGRGLIQKVK